MRVRGTMALSLVAMATIGTGAISGAASALERAPNQRLPPVTITIGRVDAAPVIVPTTVAHLLSMRDRYKLSDVRSRRASVTAGPVVFAVSGSRLRTTSPKGLAALRAPDRITILAAGVDAGMDIVDGLSLHAFSTAMRVKRRIDLLPGSSRSLNSSMMAFGVGLERSALGSLVLDYTSNAAHGRRDALSRTTEQVGGAVPFGKAMRVSLTNATATDQRGHLTWMLSAASVRRPLAEGDISAGTRELDDRRAELAFRIAL